jgi:DNA-binding TFAR19-related protein (PDSD5 family)
LSNEDSELERLKAKRLAEMQKNISSQQKIEETTETVSEKSSENPRTLLVEKLGYRGLEVLENAESQFPNETKIIVSKLSELIKTGEINETLDGGKLLALFRTVGLSIRMKTKINVEQDGKLVSLSDKFSNQSSDISDDK